MSETFNVDNSTIELVINGTSKGRINTSGQTVGAFVTAQARNYGLKSFSVYVDGAKFFTEQANNPLTGSKVEIVAKDARGIMVLTGSEGPTPAAVMAAGEAPVPVQEPAKEGEGDPGDETGK